MTTHELLVAGRNKVEKGWTKGRLRKKRPWGNRYCALGSLFHSGATGWDMIDCRNALSSAAGIDIVHFNDERGRRKREVLAVFDQAIAATAPEPFVELENAVEVVA